MLNTVPFGILYPPTTMSLSASLCTHAHMFMSVCLATGKLGYNSCSSLYRMPNSVVCSSYILYDCLIQSHVSSELPCLINLSMYMHTLNTSSEPQNSTIASQRSRACLNNHSRCSILLVSSMSPDCPHWGCWVQPHGLLHNGLQHWQLGQICNTDWSLLVLRGCTLMMSHHLQECRNRVYCHWQVRV